MRFPCSPTCMYTPWRVYLNSYSCRSKLFEVIGTQDQVTGWMAFLVAQIIGPEGRATGIDMTIAIIEHARDDAAKGVATPRSKCFNRATNKMLLPDSLIVASSRTELPISRPNEPAALREIARVLKSGGRVALSDIALKRSAGGSYPMHSSIRRLHRGSRADRQLPGRSA